MAEAVQDRAAVAGQRAGRTHAVLRRAPWLVLAAGLAGQLVAQVVQARRLWFFRDDFGFLLVARLSNDPVKTLFTPHDVHWSTLPILAYRVMWHLFGLRHYLPYALMPIVLHLALAVCIAALVRRAGAGAWTAALTALVIVFLAGGAGAENTLWSFQIGFIGSALAGMIALLCLDTGAARAAGSGGRWFWTGQGFLVAGLMCSGMGVPMAVAAAAWALLRRGWVAAVKTAALPLVVYLVWFAIWGHVGYARPGQSIRVDQAPLDVLRGIGHVWAAATAVPYAGPVVLAVLLASVLVLWRQSRRLAALGGAGLVGLVAMYVIVGFGRSGVGASQIERSRYLYVGVVLCAPAVACLLDGVAGKLRTFRWRRGAAGLGAAGFLGVGTAAVVVGVMLTAQYAATRRAEDPDRRQQFYATAELVHRGAPLLSERVDPTDVLGYPPAMSVSNLKATGAFAGLEHVRVRPEALFDQRSVLQVNVGSTRMDVPAATAYRWADQQRLTPASSGCISKQTGAPAQLAIPLGGTGAQVEITTRPTGSRTVSTWVVGQGRTSVTSTWPDNAYWSHGDRFFVASTITGATLQVTLPAGQITVCPAG